MLHRMELLDALDLNDRGAAARDAGAHLVEHAHQVDDLGLARGVVDDRGAVRADRCHDEVLGCADAREGEGDRRALEPIGSFGVQVAMVVLELNAQCLEAEDMKVHLAGADVAAAGHGDNRLAEAADERTHDRRRRAHLRDELVGSLPRGDVGSIDDQRVLVDDLNGGAQVLEHLAHDMHVRDVGDVRERRDARREQGSGHQLER